MTLIDWIRNPFVRLKLRSGNETIPQSVGILEGYVFGKELEQPALFSVPDTATGNVNVTYWNETSEIIDAQFLSSRNMLIRKIDAANTDLTIDQIRLEV
jgi:hypothetical protein